MRIDVIPGEIVINDLVLVIDGPDFKVLTGDLASKYPGHIMHGCSAGVSNLWLFASDRTLYTGEATGPTEIKITTDRESHWIVLAEASRYSLYVAMWRNRPTLENQVVWSSGDQKREE